MIAIAPASSDDVRGMVEVFYQTWLATYPNKEIGITNEDIKEKFKDSFTKEDLEKRRRHMEETGDTVCRMVAKDDTKVIGLASMIRKEKYNELQSLYVLPEYQNKGVGTLLWEEVKKFALPEKDTAVFLATYNHSAQKFYEKLGFIDTGERDNSEKHRMPISGVLIPVMKMVKNSLKI